MANKNITVQISGRNNLQTTMKAASTDVKKLATDAKAVGREMSNSISAGAKKGETSLKSLSSSSDAVSKKIAAAVKAASKEMHGSLSAAAQKGATSFRSLASSAEGSMRKIASTAKSTASSMESSFKGAASSIGSSFEGLGGIMAGTLGALGASELFSQGQTRATTKATLTNKFGSEKAQDYYDPYLKYTEKSSTSDSILNLIFRYGVGSGVTPKQMPEYMNVADALSAEAGNPVQQMERVRGIQQYMSTGDTRMLKDDLTKEQLDILKAAKDGTTEQKIAAIKSAGEVSGAIDETGKSITATTDGALGPFNSALTLMDTIIRGATDAFTELMTAVQPLIDKFLELDKQSGGKISKAIGYLIVGGIVLSGIGAAAKGLMWVLSPFKGILKGIGSAVKGIPDVAGKIKDAISGLPDKLKSIKDTVSQLPGKITSIWTTIKDKVSIITDKLSGVVDKLKNLKLPTGSGGTGGGGGATGLIRTLIDLFSVVLVPMLIGGLIEQKIMSKISPHLNNFQDMIFGEGHSEKGYKAREDAYKKAGANPKTSPIYWDEIMKYMGFDTVSAAPTEKGTTKKPSIQDDIFGKNGLLDFSRLGIKIPEFKWPKMPDIGKIFKIPKFNWKIPTLSQITNKIKEKIPKIHWKIPSISQIITRIREKIPRLGWRPPTVQSIIDRIRDKIPRLGWRPPTLNQILNAIKDVIPPFSWPWGPAKATNAVRRGLGVMSAPRGPLSNAVAEKVGGMSVGTGNILGAMRNGFKGVNAFKYIAEGMADHLGYKFYFGDQKSNKEVWDSGLCNCYDGAQFLITEAGRKMVPNAGLQNGFWGKTPHTWANIGGTNFDMAAKLIRGTWNPPKGPRDDFHKFMTELGPGLEYLGYAGHLLNPLDAVANGGNCFDMSLGIMDIANQIFGLPAEMKWGTYDGESHVWANIAGRDYDLTRRALVGTYSPPPSGPGSSGGDTFIIEYNGTVYGVDDLDKRTEQMVHGALEKREVKRRRLSMGG